MKKIFSISITLTMALSWAMTLNGCFSEAEPYTSYTLSTPLSITQAHHSAFSDKSLTVGYPKAISHSASSHLFYQRENQSGYYLYSEWSQPLSRLLSGILLETMEQSKLFPMVVDYSSSSQTDYLLETTIYRFVHNVSGHTSTAVIDLRTNLIDQSSSSIIKSKHFVYRIPCAANAQGFVEAAQKAMNRFGRDLPNWLAR